MVFINIAFQIMLSKIYLIYRKHYNNGFQKHLIYT
jgi:hypothetical protein